MVLFNFGTCYDVICNHTCNMEYSHVLKKYGAIIVPYKYSDDITLYNWDIRYFIKDGKRYDCNYATDFYELLSMFCEKLIPKAIFSSDGFFLAQNSFNRSKKLETLFIIDNIFCNDVSNLIVEYLDYKIDAITLSNQRNSCIKCDLTPQYYICEFKPFVGMFLSEIADASDNDICLFLQDENNFNTYRLSLDILHTVEIIRFIKDVIGQRYMHNGIYIGEKICNLPQKYVNYVAPNGTIPHICSTSVRLVFLYEKLRTILNRYVI